MDFERNLESPWMDTMVFGSNPDISIKVEDGGWDLLSEPKNEYFSADSVKVETDSYHETTLHPSKQVAETANLLEFSSNPEEEGMMKDFSSNPETSMSKNPSENGELMNWIKFARNSWLKNCQFLQDCTIRFLCILSLDRYGLMDLTYILAYLGLSFYLFWNV